MMNARAGRWFTLLAFPAAAYVVGGFALPRPKPLPTLASETTRESATDSELGARAPTAVVSRTRPSVSHPVNAELGGQVAIAGAELPRSPINPGATLVSQLVFHVKRPLTRDLRVFVHVDARGGSHRIHGDHDPAQGSYPTTLWAADEVITDVWSTHIRDDAPPGIYEVWVGLYDKAGRLPWSAGDAAVHDGTGRVRVGTITVER